MDGIITPEAVVLEVDTAGVGSRVCAGLIDALLQVIVLVLVSAVAVLASSPDGSGSRTVEAIGLAVVVLVYPVLLETVWRGITPGKKAMGLRVVTVEGAPIRFRHALLRMMGGLVDRLLPPGGITGTLMVLSTPRHQRVGDLLAGTIVIRDPERHALPVAVWFPVPVGLDEYASTIDPTAMTDRQYTVIRSFLLRNRELGPEARYALAWRLADQAAAAVRHQRDPAVHPEAFLLCVIARYQRRTFPEYRPASWSRT